MRTRVAALRLALPLAVVASVVAVTLLGEGCFPIPSLEEKVVELVTTSTVTAQFEAVGSTNTHADTVVVNMSTEIDLPALLTDAGIGVSELVSVSFAGASYQVIEPDPRPGRQIVDGDVTVERTGVSGVQPLITDFTAPVVVTGYHQTLLPDSAGVEVVNGMLADLVALAKNGTPVPHPELTFTVSGESHPLLEESNFVWELKLYLSIVGTVTLDLVTF